MSSSSKPLDVLADEYAKLFGDRPPIYIIGPSDEFISSTIADAIASGQPIPDDFDWYPDLPDDAVA
jgi:hypothetical protein